MPSNFESILDKPAAQIERQKPLPIGTYICVIRGQPRYDKSSQKQTPFAEFLAIPQQTLDDVDDDFLKEALTNSGTGEVVALSAKTIPVTFYYQSSGGGFRMKQFVAHCLGMTVEELDASGKSLRQLAEETPNCSVAVTLRHETDQRNQDQVNARVASTAAVE